MGTIEKATDLLFHLSAQAGACGVSELARALRLPKTSTHRLLRSLSYRHLVEQDSEGRYRPGMGLVALAMGAGGRDPLLQAARPVMEQGSRELGETFFLVWARGGELVVADRVEGQGLLRASPTVGAVIPVHATAVGKVFAAFGGAEVPAVGGAELVAYTGKTIRSRPRFSRAVQATRHAGYAVSEDEWIEGLTAVAAPVLLNERLVACLAVGVITPQLRQLGVDRVARAARDAARRVSARLEGRDP